MSVDSSSGPTSPTDKATSTGNGRSWLFKLLPLAVVMVLAYFTWTFVGSGNRPESKTDIPELVIDGLNAADTTGDEGLPEGMLLEPSADQ